METPNMFQTNSKKQWWALAACATLGLTGCIDPFTSTPNPALGVTRVMAVDQNRAGRPQILEGTLDPASIVLDKVSRHNSRIYVVFSKPVDGTSLSQTTTQLADPSLLPTYCVPAPSVTVTETKAGSTTPAQIAAEVCYDPTLPGVVVQPAIPTCFGPEPYSNFMRDSLLDAIENYPALNAGSTYVIAATGVKDRDGKTMDLKVTLNVGTDIEPVSYDPDFNSKPLTIPTAYTAALLPDPGSWTDFSVASAAAAPTVTTVPAGVASTTAPTTGLDIATGGEYFGNYVYGTTARVSLSDQLCIVRGYDNYAFSCEPNLATVLVGPVDGITLSVPDGAGGALDVPYSVISDSSVIGDPRVYYVATYLPMEDDQEYTLTMNAPVTAGPPATYISSPLTNRDGTPGPELKTAAYGKFRTTAGAPRIVWSFPPPMDASTPPEAMQYPTTNFNFPVWNLGQLGVGIASNTPLKMDGGTGLPVNTALGIYTPSGAAIAGNVMGTTAYTGGSWAAYSFYGDDRNRLVFLGTEDGGMTNADPATWKLNLFPGTEYTVRAEGLQLADGTPIPNFSYKFKTMPLDYDHSVPGYVDYRNSTAGGGSLFKPGIGNMNVVNRGNMNSFYIVQIPADITDTGTSVGYIDGSAAANGTNSGRRLQAFQPTTGTITLTNTATGADVPGLAGVIRFGTGALKAYTYGSLVYPGSWIGFKPTTRLDFNAQYTLAIKGVTAVMPDGTTQVVPDISFPFTTRSFAANVFDGAAFPMLGLNPVTLKSSGERRLPQLANGAANVTVGSMADVPLPPVLDPAAKPLVVVTSGTVNLTDAATFPHVETGDLSGNAVRLLDNSGGGATDVAIHIEAYDKDGVGYTDAATRLFAIRPLTKLKSGTQYTLLITNLLQDAISKTPITRFSVSFITASPYDATGNLVAADCGK